MDMNALISAVALLGSIAAVSAVVLAIQFAVISFVARDERKAGREARSEDVGTEPADEPTMRNSTSRRADVDAQTRVPVPDDIHAS
ncbi:MAG TPA: hypothetical protein VMV18_04165 [bacterium]|nr:hypothetical protein [bacterium]